MLEPFFLFTAENGRYSKKWGQTKAYTLRPHVVAAIDKALASPLPASVVVEDAASIPANGIPAGLSDRIFVPSVINLTEDNVFGAIDRVQSLIAERGSDAPINRQKPKGLTLRHGLRQLLHVNHWRKAIGGLINTYVEQPDGRLGYKNLSTHIIVLPSLVRSLLLEKTDFVSFDMKSSFYSLYVSLAVAHGITAEHAQTYLADRAKCHAGWSRVTGHPNGDTFKHVAVSWLTGGTLSTASRTRSAQLLGRDAMTKLAQNEFARCLYAELRQGMAALIDQHTKRTERGNVVVNALGKELLLESSADFGKAASHILVGCEQLAMRTMCEKAKGLTGIIYDAFVAEPQPVEPLEALVAEQSRSTIGVALNIKLKATRFSEMIS